MATPRHPTAEEIAGPEWAAWWRLTPEERLAESQRLWTEYLALGGSLDPEVDMQSPFWTREDFEHFARSAKRALQRPTRSHVPRQDNQAP